MGKRIIISPTPLPFCSGGVSFFCPLRGRCPATSNSQGVALGWHINAPSGRKPDKRTGYPLLYLTEGQKNMILPPFISDRRTKEHDTPSLREGWAGVGFHHPFGRAGVGFHHPFGKATGSCSRKRTKFERASYARVIDEVASLVEEWSRDGLLQSCGYRVALHGLPSKKQNKLFWFAIRA